MNTNISRASGLALLTSALLLAGALYFQYGQGLYPCEMCMWQRWPHIAGLYLGVAGLLLTRHFGLARLLAVLAGLAICISGVIGLFHAGVEYGWWEGITACSTTVAGEITLDSIMNAPLVRCDTAPWTLFGLSLAGYNGFISTIGGLAVIGMALRKA